MIFQVTLKDPGGVSESIRDAAESSINAVDSLDDDEREDLIELRKEKLAKVCGKWFEYGEYLTVEINTDAGTAIVVPRK